MATIDDKIKQFKEEVGGRVLNEKQGKIYHAFTKTNGSATYLNVTDKDNRDIRIKIYSNKVDNGSQHILVNHYKEPVYWVTANEILNLYRIVELGERYRSGIYTVYHRTYSNGNAKISTVLKLKEEDREAVLKSFYSDRENTKGSPQPACSSPQRGPHRKSGGGAKPRKSSAKVTKKANPQKSKSKKATKKSKTKK